MPRTDPNSDDLSAWLDGELEEDRASELEAELQRDPEMRARMAELEGVARLMREAGPSQAPIGFARRVMERVEAEDAKTAASPWAWLRRPWGIPLEGWALGLAAAAALLLLLVPTPSPRPEQHPDDPAQDLSPAALEVHRPQPSPEIVGRVSVGDPAEGIVREPKVSAKGPAEAEPAAGTTLGTPSEEKKDDGTAIPPVAAPGPAEGTAEPRESTTPVQLRVQSADPKMKRELLALAGRYSGAARQGGLPVTDARMTAGTETLTLSLRQGDLGSFTGELRKLGYDVKVETTDELVRGDTVTVTVDLALDAAPTAPNAAPAPGDEANQ